MKRLLVVLLCACGGDPVGDQEAKPELTFKAMHFAQYEHGKLMFAANARKATGDLRNGLALTNVSVNHRGFDPVGNVLITAQSGRVATQGNEASDMEFAGGVVIKDQHGRVLTTERATGSFADKKISAPGACTLSSPELKLNASGVEGSLETMEFTLKGPITGLFDASQRTLPMRH